MLSHEEIARIAQELYEEDYRHSEAYPIRRWRARGYPEGPEVYRVIDRYLAYLWELERYRSILSSEGQ